MNASMRRTKIPMYRFLIICMLGFIMINTQLQIGVLKYAYLVLAVIMTIADIKAGYTLYFICSYSNKYFKRAIGDYTQSILVLIFFIMMIIRSRGKNRGKYVIGASLCAMSAFLSYMGSFYQRDTAALLSIVMDVLVLWSLQNEINEENEIEELFDNLIVAASIIGCYLSLRLLAFPVYFGNVKLYEYISIAEDINPNTLAQMLVQAFAIILYSLVFEAMRKNGEKYSRFRIIPIIIIGVAIIRGGSRGALIACLSTLLFIAIINKIAFKQSMKTLLWIFGVGLFGLAAFSIVISRIPSLAERFTYANLMGTGGGSRLLAIQTLFRHVIPNNLLLGVGIGGSNESAAILQHITYSSGSTNMYVAILAELGILGVVIYFLYFGNIVNYGLKSFKNTHDYFTAVFLSLFLTTCVHGISEVVFYERYFWNDSIMLIICAMTSNQYISESLMKPRCD